MSIVHELLAMPGCYAGPGWFAPSEKPPRFARLVPRPLPSGSGVVIDYEVMSLEGRLLHREHSMLVSPTTGADILLVAHATDERAVLLREIEPGLSAERQSEAYRAGQMAVRIESPQTGTIRHAYCWAGDDGAFAEVDIAEMHATG